MSSPHKEWHWKRRRGGIRVEYHLWSWGTGFHVGRYYDDREIMKARGEADYWVTWLRLNVGPFEIEFSLNGPEKIRPEDEWSSLMELSEEEWKKRHEPRER